MFRAGTVSLVQERPCESLCPSIDVVKGLAWLGKSMGLYHLRCGHLQVFAFWRCRIPVDLGKRTVFVASPLLTMLLLASAGQRIIPNGCHGLLVALYYVVTIGLRYG